MRKQKIKLGKILFLGLFLFAPFFVFSDHSSSHNIEQLNAQIKTLLTQINALQEQINVLSSPKPALIQPEPAPAISSETAIGSSFPAITSSSFVGNAILRPDVYDYGPSIINDNGVYRMYWCSARIGGGDSIWQARSSDSINWSDFRIALNPTLNSDETDFESNGHICDPSVLKVGGAYYLYYTAASLSGVNNEIFLARSSDGTNWNKYPSNSNPQPVIKNTVRSGGYGIGQSTVFFLNGKFYHYFTDTDKGGEMLAFSTDGINWTIQNNNQPVFSTTNFIPVYFKDYNVFFAAYGHNELNHNDLYYSFSKDGIIWEHKNFSDSPKIAINGNRGSVHNAGILTDAAGNVSDSSILVYYGAGDSGIASPSGFTNAASWDIDITGINFSPPPPPSSPGSIQGFKLKMPGNQNATPPGGETVRLDNGSPTVANPYFFNNVANGSHIVSVTTPSGWSAGYTLCYSNQANCGATNDPNGYHSATPISGSSVSVNVPSGGFADLWWHYTQSTGISPPFVNFSAYPASIAKGQFSTLSWNSQNTTYCFASGGWSGIKPTNGVETITPVLSNTYTLTCTGAAGSATQNVTIKVISSNDTAPPPPPSSPGSIQGFKLKMPGNQNATPPGGETVRLDNGSPTVANPYFFNNVANGSHIVSVTTPSGWSAGYTLCYSNQANCGATNDPNGYHSATPISGSSVSVNVPSGGFADLWWHYTPPVPASALDSASAPSQPSPAISPLYRLYKSSIFGHFYTMNASERDDFLKNDYISEGVAGYLYDIQKTGTSPFYRLYHPNLFDYLYTANVEEKDAVQKSGYVYQGAAGYFYLTQQIGTSPFYRMYSAAAKKHFYTMSAAEKDNAVKNLGYTFEGTAGYIFTSQTSAAASDLFQTANVLNSIQRVLNEIGKILPAIK